MSDTPTTEPTPPMRYQIRVRGQLGDDWADWFDGAAISDDGHGGTTITSVVVDQAALHGLLRKVRDLGVPLISVICLAPPLPEW